MQMGFLQSTRKPWLFYVDLGKKDIGMLFADMGGSEEVPIWEDPVALTYWQSERDEESQGVLYEEGLRFTRECGVEMRTSFLCTIPISSDDDSDDTDEGAVDTDAAIREAVRFVLRPLRFGFGPRS